MFGHHARNPYRCKSLVMSGLCRFKELENGGWACSNCGFVYAKATPKPPYKICRPSILHPDQLTWCDQPLITRLARETSRPDILDDLALFAHALQAWAAIDCEVRDAEDQEVALSCCRECKHYDAGEGICQCGNCRSPVRRIPCSVRVVMASECCPGLRW